MSKKKVTTMEDLSNAIGVSRPTLSRYFQDPESVRESTRKKVEAAIEKYDYSPNIFAINQNRKLTKTIGIVVPYLADPFFAEIVRKIENECIQAGYWPILFSSHGQREQENKALATLRSLRPVGALIAPLGRASDLENLRQFTADVPTVIFDSNVEVGRAFVGSDNFQSIGMIVNYLCETGEPPCFLEMPPVNPNARKRRQAYSQAMEKRGLVPEIIVLEAEDMKGGVTGWEFEEFGMMGGKRLIAEGKLPSNTVLCSNDRLAIGFLAAAYQSGLKVGTGFDCALRVAGHDDHPWSRFTSPPLTTVSQDYVGIAQLSVDTLFDILDSDESDRERPETFLTGTLVLRHSA